MLMWCGSDPLARAPNRKQSSDRKTLMPLKIPPQRAESTLRRTSLLHFRLSQHTSGGCLPTVSFRFTVSLPRHEHWNLLLQGPHPIPTPNCPLPSPTLVSTFT